MLHRWFWLLIVWPTSLEWGDHFIFCWRCVLLKLHVDHFQLKVPINSKINIIQRQYLKHIINANTFFRSAILFHSSLQFIHFLFQTIFDAYVPIGTPKWGMYVCITTLFARVFGFVDVEFTSNLSAIMIWVFYGWMSTNRMNIYRLFISCSVEKVKPMIKYPISKSPLNGLFQHLHLHLIH